MTVTAGAIVTLIVGQRFEEAQPSGVVTVESTLPPTSTLTAFDPQTSFVFDDGSLVVTVDEAAATSRLGLEFEEPANRPMPTIPSGFSKPTRYFHLAAFGRHGRPWRDSNSFPATVAVLLGQQDLEIAEGDPFRLVLQRYDEIESSWKLAPSSLDLPWLRVEVTLNELGLFASDSSN